MEWGADSFFRVNGLEMLVDQNSASWNQLTIWLRQIDAVMRAV